MQSVDRMYGLQDFVYQHDNAKCHKAKTVQDFLERKDIEQLPFPSQSPDMNPMENMMHIWDKS